MRVCTKHNLTVSFMLAPENDYGYFDWKEKKAKGIFSKTMLNDFFLMKKYETQEDIFRYCTFLPCEEVGQLLPNGSYDGAIGEVANFRADFSIKPENLYISENLVDVTDVAMADYISVGHYIDTIDEKQTIITYLTKLKEIIAPSFYFFLEYSSLILFSIIFILILKKIYNLKFNLTKLILSLFNREISITKKANFLGLFFLSFSIFLFFVKEILNSSMNTKHIIVDIEQLMYSEDQIYRTEKEVCWFTKTKELDYHKYSSKNSLSHFIFYEKTNKSEPCFFTDYISFNTANGKRLTKNFFIFSYNTNLELLKFFNNFYNKDIFISKKQYLTENAVFYLSKKINKLAKDDINYYSSFLLRHGFDKKIIRNARMMSMKLFPQTKKTFYSTKEYIDYYTFIEQLKLDHMPYIHFYFLFLILILICFVLDRTTLMIDNKKNVHIVQKESIQGIKKIIENQFSFLENMHI